jgi:hypothetical protein
VRVRHRPERPSARHAVQHVTQLVGIPESQSGAALEVGRVGRTAVYLTELSGMEFYDATVRIEQIAAVIVASRRPVDATVACQVLEAGNW